MKNSDNIKRFNYIFSKQGNAKPDIFFVPGRINLIGEHLDYNGGLVMPAPISLGTWGYASKNNTPIFNVYSENFENDNIVSFDIKNLKKDNKHTWVNFIKGVLKEITKKYEIKNGFNLYLKSTLPLGGGLSSSASYEILIINILAKYNNLKLTNLEIAKIGQGVENNYLNLNSGIMDQFAIAFGKDNNAILLNTNSLKYHYIPFNIPKEYELIIGFTNKERKLTDSKYNERFAECQSAIKKLKKVLKNITYLADVDINDLNKHKLLLTNNEYQRAKHVITEQERVKLASKYLENNDFSKFCKILISGHKSLDIDYLVTGIELNTLVYGAIRYGAIGARMTGAGFGGSMFFIAKKDKTEKIIENLKKEYYNKIGYYPIFYNVLIKGAN